MTATVTLEITLAGITKSVDFLSYQDGDKLENYGTFTGRMGSTGSKTHGVCVSAWAFKSVEAARAKGYSASDIKTGSNGRVYGVQMYGQALRKQVTATGWREVAAPTSKHIME